MHSFHNIAEKKKADALANEPDVKCGVCSERCNGTIHTCHGEFVHAWCLDEEDHRTCKKCLVKSVDTTGSRDETPCSTDENGCASFIWDGQTSSLAGGVDIIGEMLTPLDEKEFDTVCDAASSRLMNSNSRSELVLLTDLIKLHFKERLIVKLDGKLETHMTMVEGLSQSTEFRLGFLAFQRGVKAVASARPFPCILTGNHR